LATILDCRHRLGFDGAGRLAVEEVVRRGVPHHPTGTVPDGRVGQGRDEPPVGVGEILYVVERQPGQRRLMNLRNRRGRLLLLHPIPLPSRLRVWDQRAKDCGSAGRTIVDEPARRDLDAIAATAGVHHPS
jgi:hypothetical protein